jgi:hypothetical protein
MLDTALSYEGKWAISSSQSFLLYNAGIDCVCFVYDVHDMLGPEIDLNGDTFWTSRQIVARFVLHFV